MGNKILLAVISSPCKWRNCIMINTVKIAHVMSGIVQSCGFKRKQVERWQRLVILCRNISSLRLSFTCSLTMTAAPEAETGQLSGFVLLKHLKPNFLIACLSLFSLFMRHSLTHIHTHRHLVNGRHHLFEVTNHLNLRPFFLPLTWLFWKAVYVEVTELLKWCKVLVFETTRGRRWAVYRRRNINLCALWWRSLYFCDSWFVTTNYSSQDSSDLMVHGSLRNLNGILFLTICVYSPCFILTEFVCVCVVCVVFFWQSCQSAKGLFVWWWVFWGGACALGLTDCRGRWLSELLPWWWGSVESFRASWTDLHHSTLLHVTEAVCPIHLFIGIKTCLLPDAHSNCASVHFLLLYHDFKMNNKAS